MKKQSSQKHRLADELSSSEDETSIPFNDDSDDITSDNDQFIEGDYVIVKVPGKSRTLRFIARIDVVEDKEDDGVFLQKVSSRVSNDEDTDITFILNENDCGAFTANDIMCKLPQPKMVGGSARKANQLKFACDLAEHGF